MGESEVAKFFRKRAVDLKVAVKAGVTTLNIDEAIRYPLRS
jgi:hypothetical protein